MLSNVDSHSQQFFMENLHWKQKNEAVVELYETMQHLVNDTIPLFTEREKVNLFGINLSDLFKRIFKRKKIDKRLTMQEQIRRNETKNYLDSNFVFINDSVAGFGFKNKNQIIAWGKNLEFSSFMPFSIVSPAEFHVKDNDIFILTVYGCSGIPCISFYVFKDNGDIWELQTVSHTHSKEIIKIRADNDLEKIIFETSSGQIGELSPD